MSLTRFLLLTTLSFAAACGGEDEETGCSADPRKDVYAAGLSKAAGALTVKIVDALPAPPSQGTNKLTLEVNDASGTPLEGASVVVTPFMPDHGHGSGVDPVVQPIGGGRYAVSDVYFFMPGLWRLTVHVETAAAPPADATFQFCLDR